MSIKKLNFLFGLMVITATMLSACSSPLADVSVRLKWLHQVQFAGNYVAAQEGYYKDEGLNVTIEPINFDEINTTIELVASGRNDFGITSAEQIIVARSKGIPVRAVAVIFRTSPLVLISMDDVVIAKPEDLIGKNVGIYEGQSSLTYTTMMQNAEIDLNLLTTGVPTSFNTMECLTTFDVCSGYATDGVVEIESKGHTPHVIWPNEYGVPFYADVIFTTDDYIAQHPDVVAGFVRATLKGWQTAIENPTLATDDTLVFDPELDKDFQVTSMRASIPLLDTGNVQLGLMEDHIWQTMYDILLGHQVISNSLDINSVYTNEFIPQ
jgi:ABC-type nitrate/sulfonate/bicarbonate transport system substrate-binding protein